MSVKNTSPKYIGHYNIRSRHSHSDCSYTDSNGRVIYPCQANSHHILPAFVKYLPSLYVPELNSTAVGCVWNAGSCDLVHFYLTACSKTIEAPVFHSALVLRNPSEVIHLSRRSLSCSNTVFNTRQVKNETPQWRNECEGGVGLSDRSIAMSIPVESVCSDSISFCL
jgi:hypothetical protein